MTIRRWTGPTVVPVLAVLALVLMAAGPSVGDRIAEGQQPSPPVTPADPVPCQDDRAVLVSTGAAEGVLFRCVGGVPVPREGPWSIEGCDAPDYMPEAVFAATPGTTWQPSTACLITRPIDGIPSMGPATSGSGG